MSRFAATVRWLCGPIIIAGIYFVAAGRIDLPYAWALFGVLMAFSLAVAFGADPSLLQERVAPGPGSRERLTRPISAILLVAHWIAAGLDAGRYQWSPLPWHLQLVGVIGYGLALTCLFWAVRTNPFYSSVVRIQSDRGQHTIMAGPYRFVRHPGYTATGLGMMFGALALGSWLAIVPLVGVVTLFIRRTLVEDNLLQRELAGYADYAKRVRYRLIAGVF